MELSELVTFNGQLLTCDDRTGIIYHLETKDTEEIEPIPWAILADGNGSIPKGIFLNPSDAFAI
jgi:soluble calcium-activated nucleotidase 1